MDIILLLRLHRLYKMTGRLPVNEEYCKVIQFFEDLFEGLIIEPILDEHPTDLFYHKNGIVYMAQDSENGVLWCKWKGYRVFLRSDIGLNRADTQDVIQTMVSEYTKREVEIPC